MSVRDSQGKLYFAKRRRAKSADEYDRVYEHKPKTERRATREWRAAKKRRRTRDEERRTWSVTTHAPN